MTIEIKKTVEETIVEVVGRLDATTAPSLDKTLGEIIPESKKLVLDFAGLEYISSAGLRVLLCAQKKMQQLGNMKLVHVCESVMDVLEITGFADILTIE